MKVKIGKNRIGVSRFIDISRLLVAQKIAEVSIDQSTKMVVFKLRFVGGDNLAFEVLEDFNELDGNFELIAKVKFCDETLLEGGR